MTLIDWGAAGRPLTMTTFERPLTMTKFERPLAMTTLEGRPLTMTTFERPLTMAKMPTAYLILILWFLAGEGRSRPPISPGAADRPRPFPPFWLWGCFVKKISFLAAALAAFAFGWAPASAQTPSAAAVNAAAHPPAAPPANTGGLMPYEKFTEGATAQRGLFTVWRGKDGSVALELTPAQFNTDFVELGIPINGIGQGLFSGFTDLQNCQIIRFTRQDNRVAILFPQTRFLARPNSPEARAVAAAVADSVAGVAKIIAVDPATGNVVFDASPFLQDITNVGSFLTDLNGGRSINPLGGYRLDSQQSYFGTTKSFPDNIVIVANQTFSTLNAQYISAPTDARNLQIQLQYNIATLPTDHYMPRYYDDRVGYFVNAHDDFSSDNSLNKDANYIVRWDLSNGPIVYYLSNTIPTRYRAPIRSALLTWNKAFAKLGYPNAVEVRDQPNDPNFDPDDIRYNVVRWLAEENGGFAEAQLLYNPYTGEMIKSGVVIDSDLMRYAKWSYPVRVQSEGGVAGGMRAELGADDYMAGERQQFGYGMTALALQNAGDGYYIPEKYADEYLESIVLHESGHDFGLRHNFIGSQFYTAKQLQSKAFTSKYGTATSVMEYSPVNLWPKGASQGDYFQTVLGPYDYYVIKWGYAKIPGASTPAAELPTLRRWASAWNTATGAWSSDEDVQWGFGNAVDPRNQQFDLTNDNIAWCGTQLKMAHQMIAQVDRRFPKKQASFEDLQSALGSLLGQTGSCASIVSRYVGGEYISRSLRGDPRAAMPLSAIPRSRQAQAFKLLESYLFSADAWNFSPALLRQAVMQYRFDDWNSNFAVRHDISIEGVAARYQNSIIARMFTPVTLQRLDDMSFKYGTKQTVGIDDLFTWLQSAVYNDVSHPKGGNIPLIRRNLQHNYAALLSQLANSPPAGTPSDAVALARYELGSLQQQIASSLTNNRLDLLTRAHLESLATDVRRALNTQSVLTLRS
jgi:hypothetical protein